MLGELVVKGVRIGSFRGEQLHPQGFFKFVTHKESIALCLHPLFNISPIQGSKSLQLLTPAESTVAYVTELCRDDYFLEHNTIKENFFANLRESWWTLGSFGLQVLAHWEGALGSTSTSGQRHTWRSQGRSPYHTTCREKQRKEWIHTPSDVGPNPFISTKEVQSNPYNPSGRGDGPIHFTQDVHHIQPRQPTRDAPIGSRTPSLLPTTGKTNQKRSGKS